MDSHYINQIDSNRYQCTDTTTPNSPTPECNELLELASQGGIQFVRATEDGRYEVMTNSEARELIAQNSHDLTILDGEEAKAINIFNSRDNNHNVSPTNKEHQSSDNQITILDSCPPHKTSITIDDHMQIIDDKDIRKFENKTFTDNIDYLSSQSKIDDLLVGSKTSFNMDGGIAVIEHDDEGGFIDIIRCRLSSHDLSPK